MREEFGRRLQQRMVERGWNQSELARAAAEHMPGGRFGRDNVSTYIRGTTLPSPLRLEALAKALGCEKEEILPDGKPPSDQERDPPFAIQQLSDGRTWLRVNQAVRFQTALKIMELLGADEEERKSASRK